MKKSWLIVIVVLLVVALCVGITIKNRIETVKMNEEISNLDDEALEDLVDSLDDALQDLVDDLDASLADEDENTNVEKELYRYSSGDSNAAKGDPELLYVYSIDDNKMSFKYHAVWNENDIKGIAESSEKDVYTFKDGNKSIKFELNVAGEDSVKVSEFESDENVSSFVTLWK